MVADAPGVLATSPPAGGQEGAEPGVMLSYWPIRNIGDRIELTRANRDYLGVISAMGAQPTAVEFVGGRPSSQVSTLGVTVS